MLTKQCADPKTYQLCNTTAYQKRQVPRLDMATMTAGMDFYVVLERPGYRVGRRRRAVSTVGIQHKVTKEDAMKW